MDLSLLAYLISASQFNFYESLDYMLKSGILTLVAILVAISIFFYQQQKEKRNKKQELNERVNRACQLLLVDVVELNKWPDSSKQFEKPFIQTVFSLENYHSVVNSGLITYFRSDTQSELTKFYHLLELHNKRVFDMSFMSNTTLNKSNLDDDRTKLLNSTAWKLNEELVTERQSKIKEKLSKVRELLNGEIREN